MKHSLRRNYVVKSTDPPWMTYGIKKNIEDRKKLYKKYGREDGRLKRMKRITNEVVKKRKEDL